MSYALGIDIGTSGIRSAVLDAAGTVLSMARAAHGAQDPARIDARLWWQAVQDCLAAQIDALRADGLNPHDITRIAVDGTSGTMVLVDSALAPVGGALMYNSKGFDAEAARIAPLAPEGHITRGANSALARAMRLVAKAEAAPSHLLHQADYIAACLTGRGGLSDHSNALKTGFDPETGRWPDWAGAVIDTALLPDVKPVGTPLATLDPAVAQALGLNPDATVCAGTTDSIAAFLASAPMEPGVAVTSLGSTLAIKLLGPQRIDDAAAGLYSHRIGDGWLVGGASNTGGAVLASFFDGAQLRALSAQIDPETASDLDYYPLLQPGERFPVNDPGLAPRLTPRPGDDAAFLHGLLESIARIEAECYRAITAHGGVWPARVYTAGGGAQNDVWTRIRARHLNAPMAQAQTPEAAVGAARLAQSGKV